MPLVARQVTVRGKRMWKVDLPSSKLGKRRRIFRETKAAALLAAESEIEERGDFGSKLRGLTAAERMLIVEFRPRLSIEEMREALSVAWRDKEATKRSLKDAVSAYLTAPREEELVKETMQNLRGRLKQFCAAFPGRTLDSFRPGELENYIRGWKASAPNHYRVLRALFNYAYRHEWVAANPIPKVTPPAITPEDKPVFTPKVMARALRICAGVEAGVVLDSGQKPVLAQYDPLLTQLIFGGLCGLRTSEVDRLRWEDVDLTLGEAGEIHVKKMKTRRKGMRERHIAIPLAARAWLDWMGKPAEGKVVGAAANRLRIHRARLVAALKIGEWPRNVLRRSFGSYHLAAYVDAAETAEHMGHTDAETTKAKYRVARRKETALEWFALTPEAVGVGERGQPWDTRVERREGRAWLRAGSRGPRAEDAVPKSLVTAMREVAEGKAAPMEPARLSHPGDQERSSCVVDHSSEPDRMARVSDSIDPEW